MLSIHPQARTTPAVRREIAGSREPSGVLEAGEQFYCSMQVPDSE
jgi:hypothetical protein